MLLSEQRREEKEEGEREEVRERERVVTTIGGDERMDELEQSAASSWAEPRIGIDSTTV
jgi:hypothetical protein